MPRQEHVFSGEAFDPATAARAFQLAGTDCTVSVLSGALLARIFEQSPRSTVLFSRWHHVVFADAEHGPVDLLVHSGTPPPLRTRVLFEEGDSCLMSSHHPFAQRPALSPGDYPGCAHVVVDVTDGRQSHGDQRLASLGSPRRAAVTVPYHAASAAAVPGTALVATLPSDFAVRHAVPGTTSVIPAPQEIGAMRYAMCWHPPRLDDDAAHRWLRNTIVATLGAA
ncbi:LysR substrate-binding domain-containing protein [Streptomyces sp. NPDC001093]|uniref:LysR substrate-binding domain-containing protein n=1 Tax=Streptomyces sp. NPDC001093 TaxID=3154376 RepID=UPI00333005BE